MREFDVTVNRTVGESVRLRRSKMSQEELALRMNDRGYEQWSQSTVSAVENGHRSLKVAEALSLARILNVRIDDLLDDAEVKLDQAVEELRLRGMAFMAAAVELDRAKRQVEEMARARNIALIEMDLGRIEHELVTLPIDEIALSALSASGGRVTTEARPTQQERTDKPKFRVKHKPRGPKVRPTPNEGDEDF